MIGNRKHTLLIIVLCIIALSYLESCKCNCSASKILIGRRSPHFLSELDIIANLSTVQPPRISKFDKFIGFYTVGFKKVGIFGWKHIGYSVCTTGKIVQSTKSSDHFLTIDIIIDSISINGRHFTVDGNKYIRTETCLAKIIMNEIPTNHQRVRISGTLMWDGDGFLEIHPNKNTDIDIIN